VPPAVGLFSDQLSLYALPNFDHRNIVFLIARFGILIYCLACLILAAELGKDAFVCVGAREVAVLQGLKTFMHG
jgi:hypothetical protein